MAKGADKIIQSLTWCPLKPKSNEEDLSKFCVIATSIGKVKLIDTSKNRILWQEALDNDRIVFDVDWNINGVLAIAPTGVVALLKKFNRSSKKMESLGEIQTHSSVRSCQFNPHRPHLLALGLFNGKIMIYDTEKLEISQVLNCCEARIVCLQWHPQFEYIIAAGSFDTVVRVFDTKSEGIKALQFHTDRVRSLQWNHEFPWLLTTGADDSYVAVWDIRSKQLIFAVQEPSLALTSFATHPNRPFTLYSSHFDASVLQWSMLGIPDVGLCQIKSLLQIDKADIISNIHEVMS